MHPPTFSYKLSATTARCPECNHACLSTLTCSFCKHVACPTCMKEHDNTIQREWRNYEKLKAAEKPKP